MPKAITCPYCGTTKTVRADAETCGSGACRVKKSRELKKEKRPSGGIRFVSKEEVNWNDINLGSAIKLTGNVGEGEK